MILDDLNLQWIYINPSNLELPYKGKWDFPKTKEDYLEHWGKWIAIDSREKLDELAVKLDPYVEERYIHGVKYNRAPEPYLELGGCVLLVYCDDREKEQVWEILSKVGVTEKAWVYEWQTIEMWMPGGLIIEKLIDYCKLNPEDAENLRKETKQRHEKWLSLMFEQGGKKYDENIWNFEQFAWKEIKRTRLIERILSIEWSMFSRVQNLEGRASCQDDSKTFEIMRSSQFMSWSDDVLESYLNDLEEAEKKGRNLLTEKYARMMKSTSPSEYAKIKELIPSSSSEMLQLIDKIVAIELEWQEEFSIKFPYLSGRGRPVYSWQDTPLETSIETYLSGELGIYSFKTLALYYEDILNKRSQNINGSEIIHDYQVKKYGYKSLEDAEKSFKKCNVERSYEEETEENGTLR